MCEKELQSGCRRNLTTEFDEIPQAVVDEDPARRLSISRLTQQVLESPNMNQCENYVQEMEKVKRPCVLKPRTSSKNKATSKHSSSRTVSSVCMANMTSGHVSGQFRRIVTHANLDPVIEEL